MLITLLTDFGMKGPYVAAMKGIILGICPKAQIVDISHEIEAHNIEEAAYVIKRAHSAFPDGSIHIIVVDPGVGSHRPILAVNTGKQLFIAPDNGVLKYIFHAYKDCTLYSITNADYFRKPVSNTFHGRDIFAPVSAHLANGLELGKVGKIVNQVEKGHVLQPVLRENEIEGHIIFFDHFGNAVSNIEREWILNKEIESIICEGNRLEFHSTYENVKIGEPLALIGSDDTMEISIRQRSAKDHLNLTLGTKVIVQLKN
jgi:S-adenosylmethionine hydrolase